MLDGVIGTHLTRFGVSSSTRPFSRIALSVPIRTELNNPFLFELKPFLARPQSTESTLPNANSYDYDSTNEKFLFDQTLLSNHCLRSDFDVDENGQPNRHLLDSASGGNASGLNLQNMPARRESFLYRSDSEYEISPKSASRHSSIGSGESWQYTPQA
ncbi:hypothetical protein BLOT_000517 [Blomia tropicalis]|nr:hypothetical protein BLOT_000517 [Blomia tropicalis]